MLAEVLADRGDWSQVMPGVRACLFSLEKSPLHLPLRLEPLHFEALFCVAGTVTLTRRDGSALTAGARQVLLLTDASSLSAAKAGTYGKRAATANHYRRAACTIGVHWLPLGRSAGWLPEWERERGPLPRV